MMQQSNDSDALIGHSGFVGSTLLRQRRFSASFRSTDIETMSNREFNQVICAGVSAQKWIAERDPATDLANIQRLTRVLRSVHAEQFILFSTVDVFSDSAGATEDTPVDSSRASAYGRHRRWLEEFAADRFSNHLIVRLPGLVGPGLKKNPVFDFRNDNCLHLIDARARYQFYPMVNLWSDVQTASRANLRLVHFAAEPLAISVIAARAFGLEFHNTVAGREPVAYDLRSRHGALFGGTDAYLYSARESLMAIRAYAQSEPRSAPLA